MVKIGNTYLLVALVPRAVLLVDEDWVANVLDDDILEMDIRGGGGASCRGPCLDSQPVVSLLESAVDDLNAADVLLVSVPSKASDTDTVSWTACNFLHVKVLHPISNGDAIVSGGDERVKDLDSVTSSQMDPISVGTLLWSDDLDVIHGHVLGSQHVDVEVLCIDRGYVSDLRVQHEVKPYTL